MIPDDDAKLGVSPAVVLEEPKEPSDDAATKTKLHEIVEPSPIIPPPPSSPIPSSPPDKETPPLPPSSSTQQDGPDFVTKALKFFSTATPGTLGAIAVGLSATTYFVLGQVGLLLIGAFGGVTLYVSWESRHPEVARAVRGEKGYDFLDRLLGTRTEPLSTKSEQDEEADAEALAHSFDDFQPDTREALNELVDAVIRDYVNWWYNPIVPSDRSFPLSCRKVLVQFVLSLSNQLRRKRPADAFVDFVTHTCSIIVVFFSEMASAYAELPSDTNMTAADAIYNYLAANTEAPLSNLLNQKQQASKFKMVAEDLLSFLDRSAYDCDPARIFLREILSSIILEGTLQTCSKAEWINGWIVYLLESGETDLSQAIDEAIQDQKAFGDVDGNVGNIGLSRGNRNSYELDRARRKEQTHKKKLSKADEEMERAMEEMKRMNQMIAEADKAKEVAKRNSTTASGLNIITENDAKETNSNGQPRVSSVPSEISKEPIVDPKAAARKSEPEKNETKPDIVSSPLTSASMTDLSTHGSPASSKQETSSSHQRFTSFDQLVPPAQDETDDGEPRKPPPLTLHNATITIHDEAINDKGRLRGKPTWEYLIQIEPSSSQHPGWMVMKTYVQFEGLHESLRRIANVSGATAFIEAYASFPSWKLHTRSSLRGEIERYMRTACAEKPLAESEAMKRFLDKAQETKMAAPRGFSFESMSKGMLGALQNAPKGAFDSGKVVMGGVTGVFNNIGLGPKRSATTALQDSQANQTNGSASPTSTRPVSLPVLPRADSTTSTTGSKISRDSLDSQRSSIISVQPGKIAPMERRPSYQADPEQDALHPARADRWERRSVSGASSRVHSRASSTAALRSPLRSPSETSLSNLKLPPPPNEISDDYGSPVSTRYSLDGNSRLMSPQTPHNNTSLTSPTRSLASSHQDKPLQTNGSIKRLNRQFSPLSENETRVAVELLFAVINELYTLSSAWNIRRTLLAAAKSFLLRPGNPSLASIQSLIQESVLEANTSDDGIAIHLRKLRENSLPTEEERKAWPAELSAEEKEELRVKARKLFIQGTVPAALMGIMGQSATSEALGRVFDCLQIEEVARGIFFGIILQAVRVITH
ncbi:PXA domain-containing protein [Biscogniauxia mediterranea]|nr:PXA domain-containing protein [Biscogniauxia mediterranea]